MKQLDLVARETVAEIRGVLEAEGVTILELSELTAIRYPRLQSGLRRERGLRPEELRALLAFVESRRRPARAAR